MGFGSTRKFSSDQLPNSPTAPVQGTELDGCLRKGSPALTGSRGGGLHRAPCARPPGRRAEGLVPAPRTRSAHTTCARPQRGGRATRSRSADVRCPQTYSQEPCAWATTLQGRPGAARAPESDLASPQLPLRSRVSSSASAATEPLHRETWQVLHIGAVFFFFQKAGR